MDVNTLDEIVWGLGAGLLGDVNTPDRIFF